MTDQDAPSSRLLEVLWSAVDGGSLPIRARPHVGLLGGAVGLPSAFAVDALATATVAAATASVAALLAARSGEAARASTVDRDHVGAAFRSERYLEAIGWKIPEIWDPIAGDYATRDGFIRIHTNYAHHRAAALRALGVVEERDAVTRAVAQRGAEELESAIVAEGGACAMMRTLDEWREHPQGRAVANEPLVATRVVTLRSARPLAPLRGGEPPLDGIRVLDLTRVIAGPVCTRVLAAYGADVLRVDPPGFQEVGALMGETTAGKRRAALDLRSAAGRSTFLGLVEQADLLVCGYRSGALAGLGLDLAALRVANPALIAVSLDAYGWTGPWSDRRGFDSLVQMSTGIAARSREALGLAVPGALPAQALDHGSGYLMAAVACRALQRRLERGEVTDARVSLARLARLLVDQGAAGDARAPARTTGDPWREREESGFGALLRVRVPGVIAGVTPSFRRPAGPLGSDPASWEGSRG